MINEYRVQLNNGWEYSLRRCSNTLDEAIELCNDRKYDWYKIYNIITGEFQYN